LVAAAITQYVHVTMHRTPLKEMLLRYSQIEARDAYRRDQAPDHPRGAASDRHPRPEYRDHQHGGHPGGHGVGSSGSFTTCLLKVLHKFKHHFIHPRELAEMACHIEIELLNEPIGKQDQYIAAFGASPSSSSSPTASSSGAGRGLRRYARRPRGQTW